MTYQNPHGSAADQTSDDPLETFQSFPRDKWLQELRAVNPWAEPFLKDGLQIATDKFTRSCKLASRARWLAGRDVWNHWADKMLELRHSLEKAQLWYQDENGQGGNEETQSWLALADAIFSSHSFERGSEGYINFEGFVFPATTWFVDVAFTGEIHFQDAKFCGDAHFDRSKFIGSAYFNRVIFNGQALFRNMVFTGNVVFEAASFLGNALFDKTRFTGGTSFNLSVFSGTTGFPGTQFIGDALYEKVKFTGDVTFTHCRFAGAAWYPGASFVGNTDFSNALMIGDAWFSEAKFIGNALFNATKFPCNVRFDKAHFSGITSFREAEFSDNTSFANSRFVGETELDAGELADTAEINSISIAGPMRIEREQLELEEKFPSLKQSDAISLKGAEFSSRPDFEGAKVDVPQVAENGANPQADSDEPSDAVITKGEKSSWLKPFQGRS